MLMFLLASLLYWNQEIFKGSESYRATYAKLDITWNKMVGYGSCSIADCYCFSFDNSLYVLE